jgi:hypothetical protein
MLAFDPEDRPTAEEALADPYFAGLADPTREPHAEIVSRTEYAFESRKLTPEEVRGLLYREILEYHPQAKREFEEGETRANFQYPNGGMGADFAAAEEREQNGGLENGHRDKLRRSAQSLPKESVDKYRDDAAYLMSGNGALKRSDSISNDQVSLPSSTEQLDQLMDQADAMSLDEQELEAAQEEARRMMEENMRNRG